MGYGRISKMINSSRWGVSRSSLRRRIFDDQLSAICINWHPGVDELAGAVDAARRLEPAAARSGPYRFVGHRGSVRFDSWFRLFVRLSSVRIDCTMRDHVDVCGTAANTIEKTATETASERRSNMGGNFGG